MRSQDEIQKAHDTIVAALFHEFPIDWTPEVKMCFHAAADVLCWVLEHEHNKMFAENFAALEERIKASGGFMAQKENDKN